MYEPLFNSVLVEIDDKDKQWGGGNDESMLGKSYRLGKVIRIGEVRSTDKYLMDIEEIVDLSGELEKLVGRNVMWNEGAEAGTVFEFDGKQFGIIYWWDIRAVKVEA